MRTVVAVASRRAVWISGAGAAAAARPVVKLRDVTTAKVVTRQRKSWASPAWAIETAGGRKRSTVTPPRIACARTAPTAENAIQRAQRRGSARRAQRAIPTVRSATVPANMRWPCSARTVSIRHQCGGLSEP